MGITMIKLKRIIESMIKESVHDKNIFKAVFLGGGPGSGKGFVLGGLTGMAKGGGISPFGVKVVNSDTFYEYLLNKQNLPLVMDPSSDIYATQMFQREKAKLMAANQFYQIVNGCLPVFIDGTGADLPKIQKVSGILYSLGYDVDMVMVNTSLDIAQQRNQMRPRKVPPMIVAKKWEEVQHNIGAFQSYFGNQHLHIVDNNKAYASDSEEYNDMMLQLFRKGKRILEAPLQNQVGKKLIQLMQTEGVGYLSELSISQELVSLMQNLEP